MQEQASLKQSLTKGVNEIQNFRLKFYVVEGDTFDIERLLH